jgi:serine O-acetyltransferase
VLAEVLQGLRAALFPNGLGPAGLTAEGTDYFVGDTLARALRDLTEQIRLELAFTDPAHCAEHEARAAAVVREFAGYLPGIRALLETDMIAAYRGDPAARSVDEVLVCYPGFTAVTYHRIAHVFYLAGLPLVARIIAEIAHSATGIDIHPGATIGESFFIDHGTGVVIGETAIIGRNVRLYQAVTLGAKRFTAAEDGTLVKGNARHPIVEDDVVVYAGATVLGRITIGRGSTIGGNVWLTYSVPPGSNVSQAQSRAEAFQDGGGI